MSFPISGSFKNSVGTERINKQITWNHIWRRFQDKTNYFYYIWYHKCCHAQRCYIWRWYQNIELPLEPDQAIVLHLVPEQAIVLQRVVLTFSVYFCMGLDQPLPRLFCDLKMLFKRKSIPHSSQCYSPTSWLCLNMIINRYILVFVYI